MEITANGRHRLPTVPGSSASILYVGALGGATVQLVIFDIPIDDGQLIDQSTMIVNHGKGAAVYVEVTGYTAPIQIHVTGAN